MSARPSVTLRRTVVERAESRCEYCLIHQDLTASAHQIDHVIASKHGGATTFENLALSCTICNRRKGSDLSSVDPETGAVAPLYNPRTQHWWDHFQLRGLQIVGLTPEGRATVALLDLNSYERLAERSELIRGGWFPAPPE